MSTQSPVNIDWLFDTNALKVAPAESPWWYTSGLIGPYYINTHFLCGGEARANALLAELDQRVANKSTLPAWVHGEVEAESKRSIIYRSAIDALAELAAMAFDMSAITHISGGERRDWFFSPLVAERLGKPCLYIFNDLSIVDSHGKPVREISGAKVMNVADLLTIGSSYVKKWVPALEAVGAKLTTSLNAVDRKQGGEESLHEAGIPHVASLFAIDTGLFDEALKRGLITANQHALIGRYLEDPFTSMRDFLIAHPEFLEQAKVSKDPKTQARLQLMVDGNLYKL